VCQLNDWREFVVVSPHTHIIGVASWLSPGDSEKDNGFVFKRVRDLDNPKQVLGLSMYLLSHTGIASFETRRSVRWFGKLARNQWSILKASSRVRQTTRFIIRDLLGKFKDFEGEFSSNCSLCGGKLVAIQKLPDYLHMFSFEVEKKLLLCYNWFKGYIPPPLDETIKELIEWSR
jgi:hypothetical protein